MLARPTGSSARRSMRSSGSSRRTARCRTPSASTRASPRSSSCCGPRASARATRSSPRRTRSSPRCFAISHAGATPVLVDVDPDTHTLDPEQVDAAVTPADAGDRARAPLRPAGRHGRDHGDRRRARAGRRRGRVPGARRPLPRTAGRRRSGDAAAFSFYPAKNLGGVRRRRRGGHDDDERRATRVRVLRNYGQREKYVHVVQRVQPAPRHAPGGAAADQAAPPRRVERAPARAATPTCTARCSPTRT